MLDYIGGEAGIRTLGGFPLNGFQVLSRLPTAQLRTNRHTKFQCVMCHTSNIAGVEMCTFGHGGVRKMYGLQINGHNYR